MMHWDSLDVLDATNNVLRTGVPATVYVVSNGTQRVGTDASDIALITQLRAVVDPDTTITTENRVRWKGDIYYVSSSLPVSAKGIVRHHALDLGRQVGG